MVDKENLFLKNKLFYYHHIGDDNHVRTKISFSSHCLTLLLNGRKDVFHRDDLISYDNTNCLIFKSGNYLSTEISSDVNTYHSLLIFFDNLFLQGFKNKFYKVLEKFERSKTDISFLSLVNDDYIEEYKKNIIHLLDNKIFSEEMQVLKLEEILLYLVEREGRLVLDFLDFNVRPDNYILIKSVVESDLNHTLSVEELAFLCHMSLSTFKRTFFEIYKVNPGKWLRSRRLEYAALLIKAKEKSPSEIYYDLGFSSLSSFIYSFKREFGITPKQYQLH